MWLAVLEFVLLFARSATAQQVRMPGETTLHDRIVHEMDMIQAGEQAKFSSPKQGRLWAVLASDYEADAEFSKAEAAYNQALQLLRAAPDGAADYATVLDNLGSLYILMGDFDAAGNSCKHSLAVREQVGNQLEIARGEAHLAEVDVAKHRFKEAQRESSRAYEAMVALHDATSHDMATALITLTYASSLQGKGADAVASAEKALTIVRAALPANSLLTGEAHIAFGIAKWKAGAKEGAEPEMRAGLEILRAEMPTGHPEFIAALEQYRKFLGAMHREQEAKQVAAEETQLAKERSRGCDNCTVSVYGLRVR
jgi:tetratricopeptide (TPR) repeat protein